MGAIFKEVISLADNMKSALTARSAGDFHLFSTDIRRLNIGFTW